MGTPEVYRFPGSPTDVVVRLTYLAEQLDAGGSNEGANKVTEFHVNSTVLKEQSKYFEAVILWWSETSPSAQSPNPWRAHLKCIDGVGPSSYAKCFRTMYEAHYGEFAETLAQTVVKSVADALGLLRVASNLGFSVGVDAALSHIQAVPWTPDEDASISECINSLQVPMSDGLAARLQNAGKSIFYSRNVLRDTVVSYWEENLLEWKNAVVPLSSSSNINAECLLSEHILKVCNGMFRLFDKAVHLGVGDRLIECLVEGNELISTCSSAQHMTICYEAVLLVLLRIMQALSTGEVVCQEVFRQKMVIQCLVALQTIFSSPYAWKHFAPEANSECLQMSAKKCVNGPGLNTYLETYSLRKSDIKRHLVSCIGLVITTLQPKLRQSPLVMWLSFISRASTSYAEGFSYVDLDPEDTFPPFMATLDPNLPSMLTGSHG